MVSLGQETTAEVMKYLTEIEVERIAQSISELEVVIRVPQEHDEKARATMERAALTCPVHTTLGDRVEMPVRFEWGV